MPTATPPEPALGAVAVPAARQLDWLLACLADERLATPDAVTGRLSPRALAATTAGDFAAALRGLAGELRGHAVERAGAVSEHEAAARLVTPAGDRWLLRCSVDEAAPHGILATALLPAPAAVGCAAPVPWGEIADHAAVGGSELPARPAQDLDDIIVALREELRLPGLLVGVVSGGALVHWRRVGYAEVATRRRPTRRTAVRLGSLTTVLTALAVHRLAGEGLIDLDDPVAAHLAAVRLEPAPCAFGEPVRIRHLLAHAGGFLADPARPAAVPAGAPVPEPAELYRPAAVPALPPGQRVAYSADGYALLGLLVADVTGRPFEDHVAGAVLDPLGLRRTSYLLDGRVARQPLCGYDVDLDEVTVAPGSEAVLRAAAGAASTLDDLARLAAVLCAPVRAAAVVPAALHRGLTVPPAPPAPPAPLGHPEPHPARPGVTLAGLSAGELAGTPVAWHCGGWPGALAGLWVAPAADLGVVVAANAFSPSRLAALEQAGAALLVTAMAGATR
ncbi:MAG: serine hydrolase domain-containing protein [Frankiaceae bacterium]